MSLITLIAKIYIIILIIRYILTQQELMYNPIGRIVAKVTDPVFKRDAYTLKSVTDKLIPLMIIGICLLIGIIYGFIYNDNFSQSIIAAVSGISSMLRFVAMFFIVCLVVGSLSVPGAGGVPVFFFRIGGIWVNMVRKIINIRSNKIIIPAIILVLVVFVCIDSIISGIGFFIIGLPLDIRILTSTLLRYAYSFVGLLSLLMLVMVIRAVVSWFSPDPRNALVQMIYYVTEPLMMPVRRIIPPLGGIDFSAIVVILLLGALQRVLIGILPSPMMLI